MISLMHCSLLLQPSKVMTNKERLEKLLELTIEDLIAKVETGEATSADLSVAVKLLKDNCVDVSVSSEDASVTKLADFAKGRFSPKVKNG